MQFGDPKYFNDFCAHPLHLFSLVGIFYPPNWQCPSCHDAFPAIENAEIAEIFACGELNLLNFEQLNPASPKMHNLNFKERPLQLLLEPSARKAKLLLVWFC